MDLQKEWTRFAADAEVDAYGTSRLCAAHNTLRAENARLLEENERLREECTRWQQSYTLVLGFLEQPRNEEE